MKKAFSEPVIELVQIYSEAITDVQVPGGETGTTSSPADWL